jgi:hypothetical protein
MRVSVARRVVLVGLALAGCGRDATPAPATRTPTEPTAALARESMPTPAPAAPEPAPSPAEPAAQPRTEKATTPVQPRADRYSVLDVEIAAPTRMLLKLRVQSELAPDLASATLKLEQPSFTVADRPIDVSGGRLSVCGIGLGPIEDRSVLTLQRGEVRVDDVYRGPLPSPPSAPVGTH